MAHWGVFVLSLSLCLRGQGLDDRFLPSTFRDDLLFELSWPGPPDLESYPDRNPPVDYQSLTSSGEGEDGMDRVNGMMDHSGGDGVNEDKAIGPVKLSNVLLPEGDYGKRDFVEIQTRASEQYSCVLPEILSSTDSMVGGWGLVMRGGAKK